EMRTEMEALGRDLAGLAEVRRDIFAERDSLKASLASLAQDRLRLDLLVEERQRVMAQQERSLVDEQVPATALAKEASGLRDLMARIEQEVGSAQRASAAADAASAQAKVAPVLRPSLAALDDPGRLVPALPFDQAKGLMRLPVLGQAVRRFGQSDGNGGVEKGSWFSTQPSASVTAPCDGWVVYAGPFRSYGQLLIINAGGGYHVILAGMD